MRAHVLFFRFRCLLRGLEMHPELAEKVTLACCILHNMLRDRNPVQFMRHVDQEDPYTHEFVPGEWRKGDVLAPFEAMPNHRGMVGPKSVRKYLMEYYSTRGKVAWQDKMVPE